MRCIYGPLSGAAIVLRCVWKPENVRWESQWEWMCWCLEVNIQYPTLRVLHVWISLSEQSKAGTGRDRKGWSQRQETGRQKERLKAVKLQPGSLFQKTIFMPPPHPHPRNHLHQRREELKMCVSHMKLGPPTDVSPALTRLWDWRKLANCLFLLFIYVLDAGWGFMEMTHIRWRWCWEQMHHLNKELVCDLAETPWGKSSSSSFDTGSISQSSENTPIKTKSVVPFL